MQNKRERTEKDELAEWEICPELKLMECITKAQVTSLGGNRSSRNAEKERKSFCNVEKNSIAFLVFMLCFGMICFLCSISH